MTYYKWIDVAKGIGILCVVLTHAILYWTPEDGKSFLSLVPVVVTTFVLPLFLFVSGFLFRSPGTFLPFLQKKIKRLVVPYFFSFLSISLFLFLSYLLIGVPGSFSWVHYLAGMLYGTLPQFLIQTGTDVFNPMWFLPVLFCALIIAYFLIGLLEKDPIIGSIAALVTVCIGYVLGLSHYNLPWGFDVAMVSQIFVIPGYYLKKSGFSGIKDLDGFALLVLLTGFTLAFSMNGLIDMAWGQYQDLFLFVVEAACAVTFICFLSSVLVSSPRIEQLFSFFGRNAIIFLCFHLVSRVAIHYVGYLSPFLYDLYFSSLLFELFCMLIIPILLIALVHKVPFLRKIYCPS